MKNNIFWTETEIEFLKKEYPVKGKYYCLNKLNRSEASIRGKSSELKLSINKNSDFFKDFQRRAAQSKIGKKRPQHSILMRKYESEGRLYSLKNMTKEEREINRLRLIDWYKNNAHPKGMKGKKHSQVNKLRFSELSKIAWANPLSKFHSKEYKQQASDRQSKHMIERLKNNPETQYSRVKHGTVTIGGKTFFARSSWEANIAAYFEFLKQHKQILDWVHEPETFWFLKIKRGVRSYKPDFKITNLNGTTYFEEVKGWMDKKSATKLKRMKKYYPDIELKLLDQKRYKEIAKQKSLFKDWGLLT